jgi:hypothetical protein
MCPEVLDNYPQEAGRLGTRRGFVYYSINHRLAGRYAEPEKKRTPVVGTWWIQVTCCLCEFVRSEIDSALSSMGQGIRYLTAEASSSKTYLF